MNSEGYAVTRTLPTKYCTTRSYGLAFCYNRAVIEIEPPKEVLEIVAKARDVVGRDKVTYHWGAYPETGKDGVRRVELVLSLLTK